jgi:hypothetical protein
MKSINVNNYNKDTYYPRIVKAFSALLESNNYVSPISILCKMELLKENDIQQWRKGTIPYLERVIKCNLSKASRILRIISFHAHDLNMKPSFTVYKRNAKGKSILLKFTKTGDPNLEKAYSKHFVNTKPRKTEINNI